MRAYIKVCLLTLCVTWGAQAADRIWTRIGNGQWNNSSYWSGGLPSTSDNAIFTNIFTGFVAPNPANSIIKLYVGNQDNITSRLFTCTTSYVDPKVTVQYADFAKGKTDWRSKLVSTNTAITRVGSIANETAWLTLAINTYGSQYGSTSFLATNKHGLSVGYAVNSLGRVTIKDNTRLSLSTVDTDNGLTLGDEVGSIGSFVQEGGVVEWLGRTFVGYQGYGAYELEGGVLDIFFGSDSRMRMGSKVNTTGLFYQRGGVLYLGTNVVSTSYPLEICSAASNSAAIYYADGGVGYIRHAIRMLSGAGTLNPSYGELTVDKAGVVEAGETVLMRNPSTTALGTSVINLNRGGTLRVPDLIRGRTAGGPSYVNGDGGTLEITGAQATLFSTFSPVILYEGGLCLSSTNALTITGTWRAPSGWGVSNVVVSAGGSNYLAPPRVIISGGSGSNATAVAFIDHDSGAVTGLVVTCRGEGYASDDTLTVSISGGGGSGATATANLVANQAGPFTKSGSGVTALAGNKSYIGETIVDGGTLLVNGTNTAGGTFTVAAGAVLGGTGVIAPRAEESVVINGSLAPGAVGGCGNLTLGSTGQATALVLNGDLAANITLTSNDCVAVFGDVTFGSGATITVSASDPEVWTTRRARIPLLTYTGTLSGTPQKVLPEEAAEWSIIVNTAEKTVDLMFRSGTIISIF